MKKRTKLITTLLALAVSASMALPAIAEEAPLDVTVQIETEVTTLDSTLAALSDTMGVIRVAYEGLYRYGEDGSLVPGIATGYEVSEDGMTYTFSLREANWSNGTPVTAADFVYAWQRLADPSVGAQYAGMIAAAGVKNASEVISGELPVEDLGVSAPDEHTFVVELSQPVPYFTTLLNQPYFYPLNQAYVEEQGDQFGLTKDNTISCGAMIVKEWEPGGTSIVLEKNPEYYQADQIQVNTLTYNTIKETQQAIMAWESGTLDNVVLSGEFAALYAADPAYQSEVESRVNYIIPNLEVPGLENENLRKALALSFDKQAITDTILKDGSIPADFLCPTNFAKDEEGVSFRDVANQTYLSTDKELAKEYFEKAKEELGQDTFEFEFLYGDSATNQNVAQFIQAEIQSNLPGVTLNLKSQPDKARNELMVQGDFEIALYRWGADYEDGTTYLDMYQSTHDHDYGHWANADYDALMEKAHIDDVTDKDARVQDMVEAEGILLNEAALFPVFQSAKTYLTNPELSVPYAIKGFQWEWAVRK